jgi:hypothetical protein
MIQPI